MTTSKKPAPGSLADLTDRIWGRAAHRAPDVQLAAIRDLRSLIDQQEQQSVFTMRNMGWSWQAIAEAAGMKHRQQAQEKFHAATLLDKLTEAARNKSARPARTNGPDDPQLLVYGPGSVAVGPMEAPARLIVEHYGRQIAQHFGATDAD